MKYVSLLFSLRLTIPLSIFYGADPFEFKDLLPWSQVYRYINIGRYVEFFEEVTFFIEAVAKCEWNKINENFRKCKQRREYMSKGAAGNKSLPDCKFFGMLSFLILAGKPQEGYSNFININKISVTETFEEIAPIS